MNQFNHQPPNPDGEPTANASIPDLSNSPETFPQGLRSDFDALEYARWTTLPKQPQDIQRQVADDVLRQDVALSESEKAPEYAEMDPYVDPAELIAESNVPLSEHPNPKFESIECLTQSLNEVDEYQQEIESLDANHAQPPIPLVEIIEEVLPPCDLYKPTEITDHLLSTATPIAKLEEESELVFDVKDFVDAADQVAEPIPGSFEVAPETYDFKTAEEINSTSENGGQSGWTPNDLSQIIPQTNQNPDPSPKLEQGDPGQVFIAETGQVIEINGKDGFDHIDLACFDVESATFAEQVIKIDNKQGSAFEIHYQDIEYALFNDGVEVRLNPGKKSD